jgi:hypothetical protein
MAKRHYPWLIFVGFLLLLTFSASRYAGVIDSILWPVRFGLIAGLSILFVWSRWRHRNDSLRNPNGVSRDSADQFLTSCRRWHEGVQKK